MILLAGLRKSFGPKAVLRGVDLEIRTGETMVVIGQSGSGKSVLLKLLIGILALVTPLLQPAKLNEVLASLHTKMASSYQEQLTSPTSPDSQPAPAEAATNGRAAWSAPGPSRRPRSRPA